MAAVLRSYLAFLCQISAFVSRYYLLWCPLIFVVSPVAGAIVLGMHLLTGTVDFCVKRADLHLPVFLWYHTLEQLSYQAGVWWGCLRGLCFNPVIPRVVFKRTTSAS